MEYTTTSRGFKHGEPIKCTYGSTVKVSESSAAMAPHLWLNVTVDPKVLGNQPPGEGTAHLTLEQAQELINQLQWFIDHHYQVE